MKTLFLDCSSGASGVAYPFIIESLLSKYGYQTTLRVLAIALVILTAPLLPALRNRVPSSGTSNMARTDATRISTSELKSMVWFSLELVPPWEPPPASDRLLVLACRLTLGAGLSVLT